MKAYGHSRRDMFNCKQGCCGTKSMSMKDCRKVVDRAHRKTARQKIEVVEDNEIVSMKIFSMVVTWYEQKNR